MNSSWSAHLSNAGAVLENGRVAHFGDPDGELQAATNATTLCPLTQYSLLTATGPDTASFLQGQLTADVARLATDASRLTAWCSAKGRMLACLRLTRDASTWYLRLPASLAAAVHQRLRLFILRAQIELHDASTERVLLGVAGNASPAQLSEAIGATPDTANAVIHSGAISVVRLPDAVPRFELHGPVEAMERVWNTLSSQVRPVGSDAWTLQEIRAGLPEILPQTQDAFIPQMANLDLLGGVNFDKGCYVGQEVIARTRNLGRLKRRMYRLRSDADSCPAPATELLVRDTRGAQSVGQIVRAAPVPEGGFEALAVVAMDQVDRGEIHLGDIGGPKVTVLPLPYAVT